MSRAEMRRADREKKKAQVTYTFTKGQLDDYVRRECGRILDQKTAEIREKATDDAVNFACTLLFVLPCEVLMDHFWQKSYAKRIPKFTELLLDYYTRWQNGELDMEAMKEDLWQYGGIRFEENDPNKEGAE